MADNDIYNSKGKYESLVTNLDRLTSKTGKMKYYCKNNANLEHFKRFFRVFDNKDTSYVRRNRLINTLKFIVFCTEKNLKDLTREDIGDIVGAMHKTYNSPKSKGDFIRDIKYMWKTLFPEVDSKGRVDESVAPYVVRHLSPKIDKSREKRRDDRLNPEEFERIVSYFSNDPRMQFYLTLSLESLGRPQEILYTKLKDIELSDNYAKIWVSEHGKEGTKILQVIDSFPYLQEWLRKHPQQKNKESFLFINLGRKEFGSQLTPFNVNRMLRLCCKDLGITKHITGYSLKRNGVTMRRIKGDSDVEIQHIAGWTSTKQLKTYDKSDQEDVLKISLVKKGLLKDDKYKQYEPTTKTCSFCNTLNGFSLEICSNCKRPLDRRKIDEEFKKKEIDYDRMKEEMKLLNEKMDKFMSSEAIKLLYKTIYKLEKEEETLKT